MRWWSQTLNDFLLGIDTAKAHMVPAFVCGDVVRVMVYPGCRDLGELSNTCLDLVKGFGNKLTYNRHFPTSPVVVKMQVAPDLRHLNLGLRNG